MCIIVFQYGFLEYIRRICSGTEIIQNSDCVGVLGVFTLKSSEILTVAFNVLGEKNLELLSYSHSLILLAIEKLFSDIKLNLTY